MTTNKKYYYLKLKDNFFDSDEMIVLENMQDGYLYSNILLKLYLRSLRNEGKLMFSNRIPFNSTILAQVTRHNVGVIEKAMRIFQDLGLVEVLDNGAIYMLDIQNYIGESSTEADRKRAYRARIAADKNNQLTLAGQESDKCPDKCPDKSPPEIEIDIELDIDIDTTKANKNPNKEKNPLKVAAEAPHEEIINLYNTICISFNPVKRITNNRKGNINARYRENDNDIEVFRTIFTKMQNSTFLKSGWSSGGKADFDWIMRPTNFVKVLEDKFTGGNTQQTQPNKHKTKFHLEKSRGDRYTAKELEQIVFNKNKKPDKGDD